MEPLNSDAWSTFQWTLVLSGLFSLHKRDLQRHLLLNIASGGKINGSRYQIVISLTIVQRWFKWKVIFQEEREERKVGRRWKRISCSSKKEGSVWNGSTVAFSSQHNKPILKNNLHYCSPLDAQFSVHISIDCLDYFSPQRIMLKNSAVWRISKQHL